MTCAILHTHSSFSVLDGMSRPEEIARRAKDLGAIAVGVTDHGNLGGFLELKEACKEVGIKYIPGVEAYFIPYRIMRDPKKKYYHLCLYVKNLQGYRNLCKLMSIACQDPDLFYYKPRIDLELLKRYHEGLIVTAGCLAGPINSMLLEKNVKEAKKLYTELKALFGDDFYFEFMLHPESFGHSYPAGDNAYSRQCDVIQAVLDIFPHEKYVITNDAHYPTRDHFQAHEVMLCVQTNDVITNGQRYSFHTPEFYIKSEQELRSAFEGAGYGHLVDKGLEYTVELASKCEDFEVKASYPRFPTPTGYKDNYEYFVAQLKTGWVKRNIPNTSEYVRRLYEEVDTLKKLGFVDYMLIVSDFVNWAKGRGILIGPGRGSVSGSLVAYLLGITDIDPLKHSLLFSRFLNAARKSPPDIDVDVQASRRDELKQYIASKYQGGLVNIGTYITFQSRASIRDVGRVLNIPTQTTERLLSLIPFAISEEDATKKASLKELSQRDPGLQEAVRRHKELFDTVFKIEGLVKAEGVHAAGVVVSQDDITDYVPLRVNKGVLTTQYTDKDIEALGLLKIDVLSLTMLDTIHNVIAQVKQEGHDVDYNRIPLDDETTWRLISSGNTAGIFQLESVGMKRLLQQIAPRNIDELALVIALYRPGPVRSGMTQKYLEYRRNPSSLTYPHPALEKVLKSTLNIIVYQEQVTQLVQELAGYSEVEADIFRRAVAKQKPAEMKAACEEFKQRCIERGVNRSVIDYVVTQFETASGYLFNLSHAVGYAVLAYKTAYLKAHWPGAFAAAFVNNEADDDKAYGEFLQEYSRAGFNIIQPQVNKSKAKTCVSGKDIILGINRVEGIGDLTASEIEAKGPYESFEDFVAKTRGRRVTKKTIAALINIGFFDAFERNRKKLLGMIQADFFDANEYVKDMTFEQLKTEAQKCEKCVIRKNGLVFGEGVVPAPLMIVGINPGQTELAQGRPFVGQSGKIIRSLLDSLGIQSKTYITNIVLCGTENNKQPTKADAKRCRMWLESQVVMVKPKVIVAVGGFPMEQLTNLAGIEQYRGQMIPASIAGWSVVVIPTFHPAYYLRAQNSEILQKIKEDLTLASKLILESEAEKVEVKFENMSF